MSEEKKNQHESEYKQMLALFINLLKALPTETSEDALYALAEMRAEIAIHHAFAGMNLDIEEALQLLKNKDDSTLTLHDKEVRDRVVAAVENLIDFAVCEEYQLYNDTKEKVAEDEEFEEIDFNSDDYEELLELCEQYNDRYAAVENFDIEYAMGIAAWWIEHSAGDYVTYMTQNDIKVRPWHMELQGYTALRDDFPSWMIPPIEYNCRCYLESFSPGVLASMNNIKKVTAEAPKINKPAQLSDIFSESVAKCGRIFGKSHPYFNVNEKDKPMLQDFVKRIKLNYYGR